jgi:hypothetical protein
MGVCHSSDKGNKKDEKGGSGAGERSPSSASRRILRSPSSSSRNSGSLGSASYGNGKRLQSSAPSSPSLSGSSRTLQPTDEKNSGSPPSDVRPLSHRLSALSLIGAAPKNDE